MLVRESLGRDTLRLIVWYPLRWLVAVVPISWGFALFRVMGDIYYQLSMSKRSHIIKNFQCALGNRLNDKKLADTARNYFRNHYVNQLQIFLFPRFNRSNIEKFHTFEGLGHLDDALKNDKGCILVHPHFGPAQLPLCALDILGYSMMQLGLPTDDGLSFIGKKVAFRLRIKYEGRIPARIVPANSFLRPIIKWLKNNGVLMMTGDGAGGGKFIGKFMPVNFLGKPTLFPVGAATLAKKLDIPLLPMFTVLQADNTYRTIIHEPINRDVVDPISDWTLSFVHLMEGYVEKFPYMWHFWDELPERIVETQVIKKGELHWGKRDMRESNILMQNKRK